MFIISTDKSLLEIEVIHDYLSNHSYWAKGISKALVEKSIVGSMCFGVYFQNRQIGFARVISDYAIFAYLADVFILEEFRGQGISKQLIKTILEHSDLQGLRKWMLTTSDAQGLYAQFGFQALINPERVMEISNPNIYQSNPQ